MKWVKNKLKTDKKEWHLWFTWIPVVMVTHPDGNEEKAWMETILRRYVFDKSGIKHGIGGFWRAEYKYRPVLSNVPDKPTRAPLIMSTKIRDESIPIGYFTEEDGNNLKQRILEANPLDQIDQAEETWDQETLDEYDKYDELPDDAIKEVNEHPKKSKVVYKSVKSQKNHDIDIAWEVKRARRNKTIM